MKNIIKLTAVLLLATLFFAGCDIGNDIATGTETGTSGTGSGTGQQGTPKILDSIEVTIIKAEYFIDEPLDLEGFEVKAVYSDNSKEPVVISHNNISGFDSSSSGQLTLTFTYNEKIKTVYVTVNETTLSSIKITAEPYKTEYHLYEDLDLEGIEVTAYLSNKTEEILDISELETEGFDSEQLGEQIITVIIAGQTDTFTVTVIPQEFTVTFNSNGGNSEANPNTKTVTQPAENIDSLPTPPTRIGYNFTEWNDAGGNSFTTNYLVTGNITVYAQWEKQTYTVTFNSNGGGSVGNQNIRYEEKASKPTDPSLPSTAGKYTTFGGWYTDNTTFTNKWDFNINTVTGTTTLYAKWRDYEIGDTGPGGGKIFYYNSTGFAVRGDTGTFYYLEASPEDLGSADWGADREYTDTEGEIGEGKANTKEISDINKTWGEKNKAAQLCLSYTNNGLADWFLPSKDELYQLFINSIAAGITLRNSGSTANYYWSSSEGSTYTRAWAYHYNGIIDTTIDINKITQTDKLRTQGGYVRAVRAF